MPTILPKQLHHFWMSPLLCSNQWSPAFVIHSVDTCSMRQQYFRDFFVPILCCLMQWSDVQAALCVDLSALVQQKRDRLLLIVQHGQMQKRKAAPLFRLDKARIFLEQRL